MWGMKEKKVKWSPDLIRGERVKRGLTQPALAKLCGCSRNSISNAERWQCSERLGRLIAEALDIEPESLMYDESKHAAPSAELAITASERSLLTGYRGLEREQKRAILRIVTDLLAGEPMAAALGKALVEFASPQPSAP